MQLFSIAERWAIGMTLCLLVLVVGAVVVVTGLREARNGFEAQLDVVHQIVNQRLGNGVGVLSSLAGMSQASEELNLTELTSFSEQIRRQYPSITSVTQLVSIAHEDRKWFEETQQVEGLIGFKIRALNDNKRGEPAPNQETYLPIGFIDPLTPANASMVGVDFTQSGRVRALLEESIKTNDVSATVGGLTQAGASELLLAKATYFGHFPPAAADDRSEQLNSLFLLSVDSEEMLSGLPVVENWAQIRFYMRDAPTVQAIFRDARDVTWPHTMAPVLTGTRAMRVGRSVVNMEAELRPSISALRLPFAAAAMLAMVVLGLMVLLTWRGKRAHEAARVAAHSALKESKEQFRNLFEGSIQGVLIHRGLELVYANESFAKMFGYPTGEAVVQQGTVLNLLSTEEHERARAYYESHASGEEVSSQLEWEGVRADGSAITMVNAVRTVNWEGGHAIQTTSIDITERKRVERDLVEASERAMAAAKTKSEFLANMSHELRTPMNGVLGMLQLLQETTLDESQTEFVRVAESSGGALLQLINDVLDFSKLEHGKLELENTDFDLREAVEAVVTRMASSALSKGLELNCIVDDPVPEFANGDPGRLQQVLTNLATNAIKFTSEGNVTIRVRQVSVFGERTQLRFEVQDTGIGIAPEHRERIFGAFMQADGSMTRRYGGTGLGLSISRQLVEQMHGELDVESEGGEGSCFWFTVWLGRAIDAHRRRATVADNGQRALVLGCTDETGQALFVRLRRLGFNVNVGVNEATQGAGAYDYDVVMVDRAYTKSAGTEKIAKRFPKAHVVELVDLTDASAPSNYHTSNNITGTLSKPVTQRGLERCLRDLRRKSTDDAARMRTVGTTHQQYHRVLLADDNPVNQRVTGLMLERLGYPFEVASNGKEVLDMLQADDFDLVLMDCHMPVMDGYEATRSLRKQPTFNRDMPVVALTASVLADDRKRCLEAGMNAFLAKPTVMSELEVTLRRELALAAGRQNVTPVERGALSA